MADVISRVSGNLGILKFSNPPFNLLTKQMLEDFMAKLHNLYINNEVKAIVVTGEGNAFVAGVDINLIYSMAKAGDRGAVEDLLRTLHGYFDLMSSGEKHVIAAVNGFCWGGGLELALACNYIVVPTDSQIVSFACPEVDYGIIPALGATQRLPRRIDPRLALKMLLGGKSASVRADQAHAMGLVDEIIKEEDFGKGVKNFANRVLSGEVAMSTNRFSSRPDFGGISKNDFESFADNQPALASYLINSVVNTGLKYSMPRAWSEVELPAILSCLFGADALEGLLSFLEKRKPAFSLVVGKQESSIQQMTPASVEYAQVPPWEKEECQMLRQTIREFAERELTWPQVVQMEETETVPRELLAKMAELDLFGTAFPEKYGGCDLGKVGVCVLADELSYFHPSTAVVMGAHASLACEAIYLFGNENQKQRYLIAGIRGQKIGAFVTTESGVGSDVAGVKTLAKKVDGGWQLKGAKQYVTNGEIADFVVVVAQTDPLGGQNTLSLFIVDKDLKGFSSIKREKKVGIHASRTNSLVLDDVFVSDTNVLVDGSDGKKRGFKAVMQVFNNSRITVSAACIGIMRRAIDEAWKFAKDRMLFGEPMYMKQNTVMELGKMQANLFAVKSAVFNAAWKVDRGFDVRNEAAAVKYFAAETAFDVVDRSQQLHGGAGYIKDYPIAMLYDDVRIFRIFEGTSEVQLLSLGKEFIKSKVL